MKTYLLIATLIVTNNAYAMEKKTTPKKSNTNDLKKLVPSLEKEKAEDNLAVLDNILNHTGIRPNPVSAQDKQFLRSNLFIIETRSKL